MIVKKNLAFINNNFTILNHVFIITIILFIFTLLAAKLIYSFILKSAFLAPPTIDIKIQDNSQA